jgi:hypothetical protein
MEVDGIGLKQAQEIIDKLGQVTSAVPAFNATTGEIIDS